MERRKFLKTTALAATAPLLFNHIPVLASSQIESSNLNMLANAAQECGKILVIIQMNGGNDGLNTVFPIDQYDKLLAARPNILMPENDILKLNLNNSTGFHPAMTEMQKMYNNGQMMIVQGVTYPNPSYSHFRSTDIWFTASDSDKSLQTGWLGRALDKKFPNFPVGYPNTEMPDPLAIQIGSTLPFLLQGPGINLAYSVPKPEDLLNVVNATTDPAPNSDYGKELTFLRLMKDQSNVYRDTIQKAYNIPKPQSAVYPTENKLAIQLKIVARLINGGLKTPIYVVNHPKTHDTHEFQVTEADRKLGKQAENLKILSDAIAAFQQDLRIIGKSEKVSGMTFSEFGRRIKSNDSLGTDHGAGAPIIFFGDSLNVGTGNVAGSPYPVSGMIGKSPLLPDVADVEDQVPMQFDFRQIYATIMQDWLCMSEDQATTVLGSKFEKLPIFKSKTPVIVNKDENDDSIFVVYPNPVVNSQVNIRFTNLITTKINVVLSNVQGIKIYENEFQIDGNQLSFFVNNYLASGTYILRLKFNNNDYFKKLIFQ
jgi:uncharacterized protein (DUF1501 family)